LRKPHHDGSKCELSAGGSIFPKGGCQVTIDGQAVADGRGGKVWVDGKCVTPRGTHIRAAADFKMHG
jgi:hypothetical protein